MDTTQPTVGGSGVVFDRPKGFKKTFPTPTGPVEKTYPVDYGYFHGLTNPDDNEPADVFVGSGALHGRFMKGKNLSGSWEPDERKWYARLTPEELAAVKDLFESQSAGLLRDFAEFPDEHALLADVRGGAAKAAALDPAISLQPHQRAIADEAAAAREDDVPFRKLLVHGVGSGKSISATAAAEELGTPYGVVAPAALRPNFRSEIQKATGRTDVPVVSYNAVARGKGPQTPTLIFDEAQRATSPGSAQAAAARELAEKARNVLLLSGTPTRNDPSEFANLFSILTGQHMTPEQFRERYVGGERKRPGGVLGWLRGVPVDEQETLQNTDELKALLGGKVDYYKPDKAPVDVKYQDVEAELTPRQSEIYSAMFGRLPFLLRYKLKHNYGLTREELARAQSFLTGPRQVSLSTAPWRTDRDMYAAYNESGKLRKAMELMKQTLADPRAKGIVYSNFLGAGLKPYAAALEREKIPHAVFHGGLSDVERKALVDQYNANRLRVALVAPAGAEGISLKGSQLIQLLDPYWNSARSTQAAARGIRFDSHVGLPEDLRNVTVQRFIGRLPLGLKQRMLARLGFDQSDKQKTVDDYLTGLATRKDRLLNQMDALLREVGSKHAEADSYFLTKAASLVGDRLLAGLPVLAGVTGARIAREAALSRDDRAPVALGALAALPLALGGQLAAGHLADKAMRAERRLSPGEEKKVLAASGVHPDTPLETGEVDNAYFHMPGPLDRLFRLDTPEALRHGRVVLGTDYQSPAVLAHELGHADVAQNGSWLSRMNQQYGRPLSDGVQALATVGAAPIAGAALGPVGGLLAGGAAGLLAGAPTLFNEYQASSRAAKTLRRAGLPEEDVRAGRKGLTGAFGTYLAAAALPAAATGLGVGLLKDHLSKGAADVPAVPTPVDLLRQAKAHSDRGDYGAKTQIVRDLIRRNPAAWRVDSELPPRFLGLTHSSGFRIHMPREAVADVLPQAALPVLPAPPR